MMLRVEQLQAWSQGHSSVITHEQVSLIKSMRGQGCGL